MKTDNKTEWAGFIIKSAAFVILLAVLLAMPVYIGGVEIERLLIDSFAALISSAMIASIALILSAVIFKRAKKREESGILSAGEYKIAKCSSSAYMPMASAVAIDAAAAFFMVCFYFKRPDAFAELTKGEAGRIMLPVLILFNALSIAYTVKECSHRVVCNQFGFAVISGFKRTEYLWSDCEQMIYHHNGDDENKSRLIITAGGRELVLRGDYLRDGWDKLTSFAREAAKSRSIPFDIYTR